jgi:pyridoxamine 5'-phosphate oxidase
MVAKNHKEVKEYNKFCLAYCDVLGNPHNTMMLLKKHDENGFVFHTNYNSRKGKTLKENPKASICFYWCTLKRQVRIEGKIEKLSVEDSDKYFKSRALESKIGSWASKQSQPIKNYEQLLS